MAVSNVVLSLFYMQRPREGPQSVHYPPSERTPGHQKDLWLNSYTDLGSNPAPVTLRLLGNRDGGFLNLSCLGFMFVM